MSLSALYVGALVTLVTAFLLLTLGAAVRWVMRRFHAPARHFGAADSARSARVADVLLFAAVALTWYNVASCWIAQFVIYPIYVDMGAVGPQAFHAFSRGYLTRLPAILLPGASMGVVWALLLWFRRPGIREAAVWAIVLLCLVFLAITPISAIAQKDMYDSGFSATMYTRLIWSHVVRSAIFTAMGLASLGIVRDVLRHPPDAPPFDAVTNE